MFYLPLLGIHSIDVQLQFKKSDIHLISAKHKYGQVLVEVNGLNLHKYA